jgi:hypothetical protein
MIKSAAWSVAQAMLLVAACVPAHAQSEFLGERFPYTAFEGLPSTPIAVDGGTLNVAFAPGKFALPRSALFAWLETSAKAVLVYFGKFPASSARILIVPVRGQRRGKRYDVRLPRCCYPLGCRARRDRSRTP